MNEKNIFESNRAAWNQAMEYHQRARKGSLQKGFENSDFTTLDRDCDDVLREKLNGLDLKEKIISQIPCNNGRELLSLMRFGAAEAVGFDISDEAIREAEQLAETAKLNAKFVRTNVLEIGDEYNEHFDLIYISEGSLQWFPDLNDYFSVVSRLLKRNGCVLVFEMHPFAYLFENNSASYFEKGPYGYKDGLDYVGGVQYEAKECFWYLHKMSDILNAFVQSGMEITEFNEYELEMANNQEAKGSDKLPLSYILVGKKK